MVVTTKDTKAPIEMTQEVLDAMLNRVAEVSAAAGAAAAEKILAERDSRSTRAQETRNSDEVHENYQDLWEEPLLLDATNIPPRPGYEQYWVRTILDHKPDLNNVAKKMNMGFKPRSVDSVPKGVHPPKVNFEDFTNVVGVHGMLLMEIPVAESERYRRAIRSRTNEQMAAVDSDLMRDHEPGKGFGKPTMSRKSTISRGAPRVMDDPV